MDADDRVPPGARLERGLRLGGLFAGPLVAAGIAIAFALDGDHGRNVVGGGGSPPAALPALMALCVIWWITEAMPAAVVALIAVTGAVVLGLATPGEAFGALGTPLLFLFVGSFFIAETIKNHGLGARMARALTSIARTRGGLLIALAVTSFVLSTVMSNSAATAIVLPLAVPIAVASGDKRFAAAVVLSVAWGASVGGVVTPVGTPPNLIGLKVLRDQGGDVSFLGWMRYGLPIGALMLAAMLLVLTRVLRVRGGTVEPPQRERVPWNTGERAAMVALGLALAGWLAPTVLELAVPGARATRWVKGHLTEEVVALVAGCSLFFLPGGGRRPALTWAEAVKIDWGVIFLFGGGILLGELARKNGLSESWGRTLVEATGANSTWAITALCTATAIVLSELTSNTATATLMAPLAASLAIAADASPMPAILGTTLGSSFGFMMPISTAPNAMAYGTGHVRVRQMASAGIVFDVLGFAVIVGGLYLLSLMGVL